tara:strand:+ start:1878 stop:2480 length:603 start_codon:yes stop_codon:yes gene_type:complete
MKKYSLLFFILFFCTFNPKIILAEPGFFLQTLTNSFVNWVFSRLDTYMEDDPNETNELLDETEPPVANKAVEEKISIQIDDVVKRDGTYYRKFSNTPFSGQVESYYTNGQLKIMGEFSDGKKVGQWVAYYMSGNKKNEGQFANGKKDGFWVYYFLNSNIKEKQFYIDGRKDGLWEKFDVNGTVVQTESYQNGEWIITTIN